MEGLAIFYRLAVTVTAMRARMADIALQARVSEAAVSRVINDRPAAPAAVGPVPISRNRPWRLQSTIRVFGVSPGRPPLSVSNGGTGVVDGADPSAG